MIWLDPNGSSPGTAEASSDQVHDSNSEAQTQLFVTPCGHRFEVTHAEWEAIQNILAGRPSGFGSA